MEPRTSRDLIDPDIKKIWENNGHLSSSASSNLLHLFEQEEDLAEIFLINRHTSAQNKKETIARLEDILNNIKPHGYFKVGFHVSSDPVDDITPLGPYTQPEILDTVTGLCKGFYIKNYHIISSNHGSQTIIIEGQK